MRDLLDATGRLDATHRLDAAGGLGDDEREMLLERVREYAAAADGKTEELRVQLARAEEFAATLHARLERARTTHL
ncbi:hypothetical protein ACFY78_23060 [Streptomyces olindensis]|uniref:hypothetical protein n=1 Tax=Streptomyces olindensis TaxID=358823 RepID=UPI0036C88981